MAFMRIPLLSVVIINRSDFLPVPIRIETRTTRCHPGGVRTQIPCIDIAKMVNDKRLHSGDPVLSGPRNQSESGEKAAPDAIIAHSAHRRRSLCKQDLKVITGQGTWLQTFRLLV